MATAAAAILMLPMQAIDEVDDKTTPSPPNPFGWGDPMQRKDVATSVQRSVLSDLASDWKRAFGCCQQACATKN